MTTTETLPITTVVPKHPHAHCDGCPLYETGTYVPSTFPTRACTTGNQLAFVGEAPGESEVKKGKPFIGKSGEVLDGMLGLFDINRSEALMTNASACHYPKEHFDNLPRMAVEHCRPRLLHELEQVGVQTAVTLGAHAMRSLVKTTEGITIARAGGPRPSTYTPGILVVPTFHPAFAMRDHTVFPLMLRDFDKIDDGIWDKWKDINYRVIRTELEANHEIVKFWRRLPITPLVVDTESGADKDEAFGGAIKDALCIGIWDEDRSEAVVFPREVLNDTNRGLMGKLFMRNGVDGQNIKYDIGRVLNVFLGVGEVLDIPIRGDRMLQSYCLSEVRGIHGLDYMSREYLGSPQWKHWIKTSMEEGRRKAKTEAKARGEKIGDRFKGLDYGLVDREVLYKYNAYDVGNTRLLDDYFTLILNQSDMLPELYSFLLEVSQMLIHVEQRGMEVDLDYNARLEVEHRELLDALSFGDNLDNFNPRSVPQIKRFFESVGLVVEDTRANTIVSLIDHYKLTGERDDIVEFCETLLSHRGASKLLNTYVLGLHKTLIDGAVHPDYSLLSATGRLKCRNPNAQNTPKGGKFRKQYVARHGKVYVHSDYKQAELRTMAWLAKDSTLRTMFLAPGDIFDNMCVSVWKDYMSWDAEARGRGRNGIKASAYGTAYGRGATSIASSLKVSIVEAKRLQDAFNARIPDVIKYQQHIKEIATSCGDLVTVFGRRRRFRLVTDQNWHDVCNEAMAHMPQSTANDICLKAACRIDKMGIPIVNLIHDDIIAEVDTKDADEVGRLMSKVMIETAEEVTEGYIPWKSDVGIAKSYGDFK